MQNKLNIENQKYRHFPIETHLVKDYVYLRNNLWQHMAYMRFHGGCEWGAEDLVL